MSNETGCGDVELLEELANVLHVKGYGHARLRAGAPATSGQVESNYAVAIREPGRDVNPVGGVPSETVNEQQHRLVAAAIEKDGVKTVD